MCNNNSPLETLAAFAICFAAGVASAVGMGAYAKWIKNPINHPTHTDHHIDFINQHLTWRTNGTHILSCSRKD